MSVPLTPATRSRLYDAVALGLLAYVRATFDVRLLGLERLRLEPATILACTHRSDSDVPVLCGCLYSALRGWRREEVRPAFAVRDDLFLPGFLAGYPAWMPTPLRRALFRVSVGGVLRRRLACHPIRSATRMRLVEILRERPDVPLASVDGVLGDLERRAVEHGLPRPRLAADVLRGEYGDILWHRVLSRDELGGDGVADVWGQRSSEATADLRRLVGLLRAGSMLFIFPEGRPSPDGSLGPVLRGVGALARRGGGPVQPLALAYDPLRRGRRRVVVAVGEPLAPGSGRLEDGLLAAFRRTMPLTAGQLVADRLADGRRPPSAAEASAEAEEARRRGRPVEPELLDPDRAAARVDEAAAVAASLGAAHAAVARLARTYRSAREP